MIKPIKLSPGRAIGGTTSIGKADLEKVVGSEILVLVIDKMLLIDATSNLNFSIGGIALKPPT